jgi:hypothetical protein
MCSNVKILLCVLKINISGNMPDETHQRLGMPSSAVSHYISLNWMQQSSFITRPTSHIRYCFVSLICDPRRNEDASIQLVRSDTQAHVSTM